MHLPSRGGSEIPKMPGAGEPGTSRGMVGVKGITRGGVPVRLRPYASVCTPIRSGELLLDLGIDQGAMPGPGRKGNGHNTKTRAKIKMTGTEVKVWADCFGWANEYVREACRLGLRCMVPYLICLIGSGLRGSLRNSLPYGLFRGDMVIGEVTPPKRTPRLALRLKGLSARPGLELCRRFPSCMQRIKMVAGCNGCKGCKDRGPLRE